MMSLTTQKHNDDNRSHSDDAQPVSDYEPATPFVHQNIFAYVVLLFSFGVGGSIYLVLSRIDDVSIHSDIIIIALIAAFIVMVMMLFLVGVRLTRLWRVRKSRKAGAQLHLRLALLFGGIAAIPSILVAMFAVSVLDQSLRGWFADRISTAITESVDIANAYYDEHTRSVEAQLLIMANDINREGPRLINNPQQLNAYVTNQTALRNLSESVIIDGTGQVLAKSQFAFSITFTTIDDVLIEKARSGDVVQLNPLDNNKIQALIKLNSFVDAYLLVGRYIDENVLEAVNRTQLAAADYQSLSIRQFDLQLSFAVMFSVVAILMVLSSLWLGLNLAHSIAGPLVRVVAVADEVRRGNWQIRVEEQDEVDEISRLGVSFNSMLDELSSSREQLVKANHQLDARREFTEAVLGGVSSGVIGLDKDTQITLPNEAACDILRQSYDALFGQRLGDVIPEFAPLIAEMKTLRQRQKTLRSQIELNIDSKRKVILVQIARETVEGRLIGYVVTFDDITDLMAAQRKAAWADVARRIAHEIKNPLTPITLATDRLIKKHLPDAPAEQERFKEYVSIISRQVEDIGRMVDEFSRFARMPSPVFAPLDLVQLTHEHQPVFALETHQIPKITISSDAPSYWVDADAGLLRQALTNILKNATESMSEARQSEPHIDISMSASDDMVTVSICDNGPGFAEEQPENYLEPYVTSREKGTGLGLAIVNKIVMEHNGTIELTNHKGGGEVRLKLPLHHAESTG